MSDVCDILRDASKIVVVGVSGNPLKISRRIANYLSEKGYEVAGVNPAISSADGIPVYKSLRDVPFKIDIINVFRRSSAIPDLLEDILAVKPKVVWLQSGIIHHQAIEELKKAGIIGIQDRCIMIDHLKCI